MTNTQNEGTFMAGDKSFGYIGYGDIDPKFPYELTEPLYEQVDIKAKTPEALQAAVRTAVEAVKKAEKEESPEKPHSIASRVAGNQKDVRVRLCVVF